MRSHLTFSAPVLSIPLMLTGCPTYSHNACRLSVHLARPAPASSVMPDVGSLLHSSHIQKHEVDFFFFFFGGGVKTGFLSTQKCWCQAEVNLRPPHKEPRNIQQVYFSFGASWNEKQISAQRKRPKSLRKQKVNPRGCVETWLALMY